MMIRTAGLVVVGVLSSAPVFASAPTFVVRMEIFDKDGSLLAKPRIQVALNSEGTVEVKRGDRVISVAVVVKPSSTVPCHQLDVTYKERRPEVDGTSLKREWKDTKEACKAEAFTMGPENSTRAVIRLEPGK